MKISHALYQPHIQHDLKRAAAFIDNSLRNSHQELSAALSGNNQIQIRNAEGIVVKTYQGEKVALKMNHIDEYV